MIGKLLGHNKIDTTSRYAHLAQDSIKASKARVADSIGADVLHRKSREAAVAVWPTQRHSVQSVRASGEARR